MPQTGLRKIVAESSHVNISPFGHSKLEGIGVSIGAFGIVLQRQGIPVAGYTG